MNNMKKVQACGLGYRRAQGQMAVALPYPITSTNGYESPIYLIETFTELRH